jgi:DNA repair exonuclease SbcCD ATPase subunit
MTGALRDFSEIERQIALIRANLAELVEQAAAYSGAADENLASERIAELETKLKALLSERDKLQKQPRRPAVKSR